VGESGGKSGGEPEDEIAKLREELDAARRKADENWDLFLRSRADFENFRRRTERDLALMVRLGKRDLFLRLLDVADGFGRALDAANADAASLRRGIEMLSRQLDATLAAEGVKPIPSVGEKFNPALHEAVATWPSPDVTEETVTEEIQKGYTYEGDVLRAAKVRVAKPAPSTDGQREG
jgi:molecular chaperone GrpE